MRSRRSAALSRTPATSSWLPHSTRMPTGQLQQMRSLASLGPFVRRP